jgi:CHAT domain-containing protein
MRYISLLLAMMAVSITWHLIAQRNGSSPARWQEKYKEAKRLFELSNPTEASDSIALQLFQDIAGYAENTANDTLAANCFVKVATIHQTYQRYTDANRFYHRAITTCLRQNQAPQLLYEAYLYIGTSFYYTGVIDSARYYFEAASDIALGNTTRTMPEKVRLYNSLGAIYYESADYGQSKNYFEKALASLLPSDKEYEVSYAAVRCNIANCLLELDRPIEALEIYKKLNLDTTLRQTNESKGLYRELRHNMGHAFFRLQQYDSALQCYKGIKTEEDIRTVKMLNDLGRIFVHKQDWQRAEQLFDSAVAFSKKIAGATRNKDRALSYSYRSLLAEKQGLVDEAIFWCNSALDELYMDFKWKKAEDLPADEVRTVSHFAAFDVLSNKARMLKAKYRITNNIAYLEAALNTYLLAIRTAGYIKRNFDNDEAKLFFNNNYRTVYYLALSVAHELIEKEKKSSYANAYTEIIEGYKGNIISQNLNNIELKATAAIPDSVRKREKQIKQSLALYGTKLNNSRRGADAELIEKRLLELQVELSRIQTVYEDDPQYALFKYQATTNKININSIQNYLDHRTAVLNYVVADSVIYGIAVSKGDYHISRLSIDSTFSADWNNFFRETYNHEEGQRYQGFMSGYQLYRHLISPFGSVLDDAERWVIVPDQQLNYLPFEAMTVTRDERNYLMMSKNISYHYSFALLMQTNSHHDARNLTKAGMFFAPFVKSDTAIRSTGLPVLPFSAAEQGQHMNLIKIGNAASKEHFIEQASQYNVLHLATHASSGGDTSGAEWIQFYPTHTDSVVTSRLYTPEIYNLQLTKTDLVILSACETAGGRTTSGEGLLSLSRAFLYAGSNGIVSTLWKTDDRVAAYLMKHFHTHFAKSGDATNALWLAKKELLKDETLGVQYKTPNYWANFVYIGQINRQDRSGYGWLWLLLVIPILLLTRYWLYAKSTA